MGTPWRGELDLEPVTTYSCCVLSFSSRMRKKRDGHEYLGAGVKISGLSGELGN